MADKASKSATAGGGPGTTTAGQVKSTMQAPFGKRNTKRSTGKRAGSRR